MQFTDFVEFQVKWSKALTGVLILQSFDRVNLYVSKTSVICVFLFPVVFNAAQKSKGGKKGSSDFYY